MSEPDSAAGPRIDPASPSLYDQSYYGNYEGAPYEKGGHWTRFFGAIADEVVARFAPKTALDAGCALGVFVGELRHRGVDAWGMDLSDFAVSQADAEVQPYLRTGSLAEGLHPELPKHFDLISCIEVLEHLDVADGDRAIAILCAATDRILFASTPDGFAEATHFACRAPEEWSAVFARHGFFRDLDANASFLAPWAVVYTRQNLTTYEAVARYDRKFARYSDENRQLRERVIALEKDISDLSPEGESDIADLRRQVIALRDELHNVNADRERLRTQIEQLHSLAAEEVAVRETALNVEHQQELDSALADTRQQLRNEYESTTTWQVGRRLTGGAAKTKQALRRLTSRDE